MTDNKFVKIIIPYFSENPIELYIRDNLIPTDLDMIRFKAINCLASEKSREEIINDVSKFLKLTGIETIEANSINPQCYIQEFSVI